MWYVFLSNNIFIYQTFHHSNRYEGPAHYLAGVVAEVLGGAPAVLKPWGGQKTNILGVVFDKKYSGMQKIRTQDLVLSVKFKCQDSSSADFSFICFNKDRLEKTSFLLLLFHQKLTSIEGTPPSPLRIIFHQRLAQLKMSLSKLVLHWRLFYINSRLPSKVVFHQRSSSLKACLPSKVVFPQR